MFKQLFLCRFFRFTETFRAGRRPFKVIVFHNGPPALVAAGQSMRVFGMAAGEDVLEVLAHAF